MTTRKGHQGGDYTPEACRNPEAKENTRRLAIEIAQQSPCLWSETTGTLRCDWMELAGHHAPTLQSLRSLGILGNRKFIGIDTDADIIRGCETHYGQEDAVWVQGNMLLVLDQTKWKATTTNVGVLVYDSHDGAHGKHLKETLRKLDTFAQGQKSKLGAAMLVVNVAADPRYLAATAKKSRRGPGKPLADTEQHLTNKAKYAKVLSGFVTGGVSPDSIVEYRSNTTPMWWVALTYGF